MADSAATVCRMPHEARQFIEQKSGRVKNKPATVEMIFFAGAEKAALINK